MIAQSKEQKTKQNLSQWLWIGSGVLALALIFIRVLLPEILWPTILVSVLLVGALVLLLVENRKALMGRTAAYGLNSVVTVVLVLGIVGVVNFLGHRYPYKLDLTKNKVHTLSEQSVKVVKGLQQKVKLTIYTKSSSKEQFRSLVDNYKGLNPQFETEFVDPDKEPTRAKAEGISKYDSFILEYSGRKGKGDEITEEKVTNALMKIVSEKRQVVCVLTGHGERSFQAGDANGYEGMKKGLEEQSYSIQEVALAKEGKISEDCSAIALVGATSRLFPAEVKAIEEYLDKGGRALISLDMGLKDQEVSPEVVQILEKWHIKAPKGLVVDPFSKMLGVDASVPILATFNKENAVTRDFQGNCFFPFARPLEVIPGAPASLKVDWLAKTTPQSWAETDIAGLVKGQAQFNEGKDVKGPVTAAVFVDGKKNEQATRATRMVVFGSTHFASNNYQKFGGNYDLWLNAASWVLEDENMIAIRKKEDEAGKVELSQKTGSLIFMITVILIPLLTAIAGVVIWIRRKKL